MAGLLGVFFGIIIPADNTMSRGVDRADYDLWRARARGVVVRDFLFTPPRQEETTMQQTLEQYLRRMIKEGATEFRIATRIVSNTNDAVDFYVHPLGKDGESADFVAEGDRVFVRTQQGVEE